MVIDIDIKEQLKQYSYLKQELTILEQNIEQAEDYEDLLIIYAARKREIEQRLIEIQNIMSLITDARDRVVIHKKYVDCKTWECICVEMNYSYRGIQKIHSKILQELRNKCAVTI